MTINSYGAISISQITNTDDKAQEKFYTLADQAPIGIFYSGPDGIARYANKALASIIGYSVEEIIGELWYPKIHPDDRDSATRQWLENVAHEEAWTDEYRFQRPDGGIVWVLGHTNPQLDTHGKIISHVGTITDITDRKRAETELLNAHMELEHRVRERSRELNFQKVALDKHAIVSITDVKGNIVEVNSKFCEITGFSRKDLFGENHRILDSGSQPRDFWHKMYLTVSKGMTWNHEVCNRAKDGHLFWVDTTIVPHYDTDNKLDGYISIQTDISKLKQTELSLVESNKVAEAATKAKSQFLANMSHEIRTPMNGVIGMSNLLLDGNLPRIQYDQALTIKRSAESLLGLINDILDYSKIEAGKLNLELLDFDLGDMLGEFASIMSFQSEQKGLELICPASPMNNRRYTADAGRIRQILTNLVGNAIKFTSEGEIAVHFSIRNTTENHELVRFDVVDTGIGIDTDKRQNLFGRFTQADGIITREYGGTGLGLAISDQLVEMMGGEIGVESQAGKGSNFWFTLNLKTAPVLNNSLKDVECLSQERILVVDDNKTNCSLLDQILNNWGIAHNIVDSGLIALDHLSIAVKDKEPYSLALIDMTMPGMDGKQLSDEIRKNNKLSDLGTILMVSQKYRCDALENKKFGGFDVVTKPVNDSELYRTLIRVTGNEDRVSIRDFQYQPREVKQYNARILVVDDNPTNQMVMQGMLEKFGVIVKLVANGKESIAKLTETTFDLILMDCQMPIMDGYEATHQIRKHDYLCSDKEIPIIAMTANVMQGDRQKCLNAGMNDHLAKPVNPGELTQILDSWLPRHCSKVPPRDHRNDIVSDENHARPDHGDSIKTDAEEIIFDYEEFVERLLGNSKLMKLVASTFIEDMDIQLAKIRKSLNSEDLKTVASLAHKIRGSAGNVSGKKMQSIAKYIQESVATASNELLSGRIDELGLAYLDLKAELDRNLLQER